MQKTYKVFLLQFVILIVVSTIFYFWKGLPLSIIFAMIWFDKAILSLLSIPGEFGIELISIPVILAGIVYGPLFGFLTGLFMLSLLGGIIEMISWIISPPLGDVEWIPVIPTPYNIIIGLSGLIAGFLGNALPLIVVVGVCSLIDNVLGYGYHKFTTDEHSIYFPLNLIYNLVLVMFFGKYLLQIIMI